MERARLGAPHGRLGLGAAASGSWLAGKNFSRIEFPPPAFFPSSDVAFAFSLDSRAVPAPRGTACASRIPSLLHAGCAPVASFDGSSSPAGPTGQTKSFCNKGKVGINPFLNCTPRKLSLSSVAPCPSHPLSHRWCLQPQTQPRG